MRHHWSRADKRLAYRTGIGCLEKPRYPGEPYSQRLSFGLFMPENEMYDESTSWEYVEFKRGRKIWKGRDA